MSNFDQESQTVTGESPEIFRLLVDSVRDYAIYMLDVNGYIESWNMGAERAKQYASSEIIGKHFSIFYTPEERAYNKPAMLLNLALKEGRVEDEGWRVRKDGTRFWADVIVTPVFDKDGMHRGFAKVTRDMTEKRMLIEAKEEALRASHAKSAFLANMSHELRTPLTGIIGYAEMIQENARDAGMKEIADDLDKILYSANHLQSIVSDILDLSKIEAGRLELKNELLHLDQVVAEVVETIKPLAMCTNTEIRVQLDAGDIQLKTDRTRLRQILYNLFSNAAKFTHEGTITVKAHVDTRATPDVVRISVADTGVGMSETEAANIFERFYRAEIHINQYNQGGTGLGLAICRMLCEAMGGTVQVKSAEGKGSTFTVALPVDPPSRPANIPLFSKAGFQLPSSKS